MVLAPRVWALYYLFSSTLPNTLFEVSEKSVCYIFVSIFGGGWNLGEMEHGLHLFFIISNWVCDSDNLSIFDTSMKCVDCSHCAYFRSVLYHFFIIFNAQKLAFCIQNDLSLRISTLLKVLKLYDALKMALFFSYFFGNQVGYEKGHFWWFNTRQVMAILKVFDQGSWPENFVGEN